MSGNMLDLSGWRRITCAESDELRQNKTPVSSLTDLSGQYGEPTIYTEWAGVDGKPVLRASGVFQVISADRLKK